MGYPTLPFALSERSGFRAKRWDIREREIVYYAPRYLLQSLYIIYIIYIATKASQSEVTQMFICAFCLLYCFLFGNLSRELGLRLLKEGYNRVSCNVCHIYTRFSLHFRHYLKVIECLFIINNNQMIHFTFYL